MGDCGGNLSKFELQTVKFFSPKLVSSSLLSTEKRGSNNVLKRILPFKFLLQTKFLLYEKGEAGTQQPKD